MIYLIGGAPRTGKSILCQQVAAHLGIGWVSTDILEDLLRFHKVEGIKTDWNAEPEAIAGTAQWFYPSLERFAWGVNSLAESYVIEGVDFLPEQVLSCDTLPGAFGVPGLFKHEPRALRPLPRAVSRLCRAARGDAQPIRPGHPAMERVHPPASPAL